MVKPEVDACALCANRSLDVLRLFIRQERLLDSDRTHQIALCPEHASALRAGVIDPQQIIFDWTKRHHEELYENTRLVLRPELRCLACNDPLCPHVASQVASLAASSGAGSMDCRSCSATNVIGSALGYVVAIRLRHRNGETTTRQ
jgi:hypothetical protein